MSPWREDRSGLAARANAAAHGARRTAPVLSERSSREAVIAWLAWNDPNGCYEDAHCLCEGMDPLDTEGAWAELDHTLTVGGL